MAEEVNPIGMPFDEGVECVTPIYGDIFSLYF